MTSMRKTRRGSTVYFEEDIIKRLKIYGIMTDRPMSDIVNDAVSEFLDKRDVPEIQKAATEKTED